MPNEIKDDLEFKVHAWFKKKLKSIYPTAWIHKPRSGTYGKKGTPDFLICIKGYFIAVEVKRISGKLTPMQKEEIKRIEMSEGLALVLYGKDDSIFKIISDYLEQK